MVTNDTFIVNLVYDIITWITVYLYVVGDQSSKIYAVFVLFFVTSVVIITHYIFNSFLIELFEDRWFDTCINAPYLDKD